MINLIRGTLATCQFELSRSLTPQRLAVSAVLVMFPAVMMTLLIRGPQIVNATLPEAVIAVHAFSTFAIVFLVSMVCVLTLLLWAPANIYSDRVKNGLLWSGSTSLLAECTHRSSR